MNRGHASRWGRTAVVYALLAFTAGATSIGASGTASAPFDIARHHGRVVIVDFWASWCKPCRQSIPWLNAMRQRYGAGGLTIIGVNVDADRGDADRFLRDVPIDFEIIFDPEGQLARQFKVKAMPTSFVFDRAGKLVETHLGFRSAKKDDHEAAIARLLNRPAT
jgi:cytochrome c biogenesis protein CcmG/thiol:disulfide interchange protein DsbE